MKKVAVLLGKAMLCIAVPVLCCFGGYHLTRVTVEPVGRLIRYSINHFTAQQESNRATDDMNAALERALEEIETGLGQFATSSDNSSSDLSSEASSDISSGN